MAAAHSSKLTQLRGLLEAACRVSSEAFEESHPLPALLQAARAEIILAQEQGGGTGPILSHSGPQEVPITSSPVDGPAASVGGRHSKAPGATSDLPAASTATPPSPPVAKASEAAPATPPPGAPPPGAGSTAPAASPTSVSFSSPPTSIAESSTPRVSFSPRVCQARMARAGEAGHFARQKLDGHIRAVPETPALDIFSRFYIVLRGKNGERAIYPRWRTTSLGPGASTVVIGADGSPAPGTVFHGFPSRGEVRAYLVGADLAAPEPEWVP